MHNKYFPNSAPISGVGPSCPRSTSPLPWWMGWDRKQQDSQPPLRCFLAHFSDVTHSMILCAGHSQAILCETSAAEQGVQQRNESSLNSPQSLERKKSYDEVCSSGYWHSLKEILTLISINFNTETHSCPYHSSKALILLANGTTRLNHTSHLCPNPYTTVPMRWKRHNSSRH